MFSVYLNAKTMKTMFYATLGFFCEMLGFFPGYLGIFENLRRQHWKLSTVDISLFIRAIR